MKKLLLVTIFFISLKFSYSATCTLTASTNWTIASSWSCGHVPLGTDNIVIPNGFTVTITTAIDLSAGNLTNMTIAGTLFFSGNTSKLELPITTTVVLTSTGQITSNESNGSQKFKIGNNTVWTSNSGTVTGPSTATSSSGALPIELLYFNATKKENYNLIEWMTATETNNDYYTIETAVDALSWKPLSDIQAYGTTVTPTYYVYKDFDVDKNINYYRLKQTDYDLMYSYSNSISIDNSIESRKKEIRRTNLLGQSIESSFNGVQIIYYNDGTTTKVLPIDTK